MAQEHVGETAAALSEISTLLTDERYFRRQPLGAENPSRIIRAAARFDAATTATKFSKSAPGTVLLACQAIPCIFLRFFCPNSSCEG
jgi:hypothetical protein